MRPEAARRVARAAPAAPLLAVTLLAGCGGGSAVSDLGTVVEGAKGATVAVELGAGRRFSLAVPDDPKAGDQWTLVAVPDPLVASYISKEHPHDRDGTSYFVFNTKRPGQTRIRLYDCWRCGGATTPPTGESQRLSGEAVFELTVR
ncbi:protease inhibitor I42 family protein [Nonomuraea lactucae]|uniref:protease inhibitor I42 family protein n=1 Tax=Nonomuraea lactucae TaxID=2249762 RepID=UPI000DE1A878|nr:protease inhibitor I42 family protein [Nonomuraea lactucae]